MVRHISFEIIWDTVLGIPPGCVASYGQVARVAGLPGRHRLVGKAMRELPEGSAVPWQRVINASGRISLLGEGAELQRELLEAEGVRFDERGRVDWKRFGWEAD